MEVQPLEVYADDSNYAVVKPPGRRYPGAVIQGDTLRHLCGLAVGIATWFRDAGATWLTVKEWGRGFGWTRVTPSGDMPGWLATPLSWIEYQQIPGQGLPA